jgi:hypothetical protein
MSITLQLSREGSLNGPATKPFFIQPSTIFRTTFLLSAETSRFSKWQDFFSIFCRAGTTSLRHVIAFFTRLTSWSSNFDTDSLSRTMFIIVSSFLGSFLLGNFDRLHVSISSAEGVSMGEATGAYETMAFATDFVGQHSHASALAQVSGKPR